MQKLKVNKPLEAVHCKWTFLYYNLFEHSALPFCNICNNFFTILLFLEKNKSLIDFFQNHEN